MLEGRIVEGQVGSWINTLEDEELGANPPLDCDFVHEQLFLLE